MTDAPVRARGLVREFGGVAVVDGVDLTLEVGDALVLVGPNGAGKTTLLRLLALGLRPTRGELRVFGHEARTVAPAVRARIGYVGHESLCYPDLTAAENLGFYARLFAVPDAAARVEEMIAWAGLGDVTRRTVRAYSRGTAQRLALARALLHDPALLLLDEPFAGLDPDAVDALRERLGALVAGGRTVVLTTHDVERAVPLATRLAVLHRGRIAWEHRGAAPAAVVRDAYRTAAGGT